MKTVYRLIQFVLILSKPFIKEPTKNNNNKIEEEPLKAIWQWKPPHVDECAHHKVERVQPSVAKVERATR